MNIINLDAYREQKRVKRTATKPAFMMCWVMFVPTMPVMLPSRRAIAFGA